MLSSPMIRQKRRAADYLQNSQAARAIDGSDYIPLTRGGAPREGSWNIPVFIKNFAKLFMEEGDLRE